MICLYLEAPFAACRTFTAGWYRPTATFITPSAIYGLLLNVAGIESRLREEDDLHDGSVPATTTRCGLPIAEIALGMPALNPEATDALEFEFPRTQSVFQQLHNYPVGSTGKSRAASCFGSKYNITPVRREFLSDIRAVVALRGNLNLEKLVERGLQGELNQDRYGIPFLGDNAFLLDRLEIVQKPMPCRWFERVSDNDRGIREHATRLTEMVNRKDPSHTKTGLYAPSLQHMFEPTEQSWVRIAPIEELSNVERSVPLEP